MELQLKKVLIITNLPTPYKIDFYRELGKYCELTVVIEARRLKAQKFNWNDSNIKTFRLVYLNDGYLNEHKINFKVLRYLKRSYDRIIIAAYYMPTELLALAWLKIFRIPYWFESDGGMINRGESELSSRFKKLMIGGAEGWLSPSAGTDEYLFYNGANPLKIHRYPFTSLLSSDLLKKPVPVEEKAELRKKLNVEEPRMVLAVGQFIHRKGFDILMKSASGMKRDIGFYIVGCEPTDEYIRMRKQLNLKNNVHFVGFKTKEELAEYYLASDLFVLPTREDIWGLVINEAMGYGLPVVTTWKCVAGVELIEDKNCLIEPDNDVALKNAIERILNDNKLLQDLSEKNLHKIQSYTIENMAECHAKILKL